MKRVRHPPRQSFHVDRGHASGLGSACQRPASRSIDAAVDSARGIAARSRNLAGIRVIPHGHAAPREGPDSRNVTGSSHHAHTPTAVIGSSLVEFAS